MEQYNTFDRGEEHTKDGRRIFSIIGGMFLALLCGVSAMIQKTPTIAIEEMLLENEKKLSVINRECEESGFEFYRFVDSDKDFSETVVQPGCSLTLQSSNSVFSWKLQRIWSGSGTIPESRIENTVVPHENNQAVVQLWSPGLYEISAQIQKSELIALRLRVVYLRREIRSLSRDERTNYLKALAILATTDTKLGQELYGSDYSSLIDLNIRHYNGATAGRVSDFMHEGLGFLSQHTALTNEFEKSLQSVDPRISVPYWDFTLDSIARPKDVPQEIPTLVAANPSLWSEPDGFFAITSELGAQTITPLTEFKTSISYKTNSYGYLRAPWNLNPDTKLTRYFRQFGVEQDLSTSWPLCSTHANFIKQSYSLYQFLHDMENAPHGATHIATGGVDGGPTTKLTKDFLKNTGLKIVSLKVILIAMWRLNVISPPDSCDHECLFICPEMAPEHWNRAYFDNPAAQSLDHGTSANLDANGRIQVVKAICATSWRFGEQTEAASPRDALSFYPIHPTLERLYHYKVLLDPHFISNDEWKAILNNKPLCSYNVLGSNCFGHHPDDQTVFSVTTYDSATGAFQKSDLTVRQVLDASNPWDYHLDYIYDNFEWPHCPIDSFQNAPHANYFHQERDKSYILPLDNDNYGICNLHCASRENPVLGGIDVVAYHSLHWDLSAEARDQPVQGRSEYSVIVEGSFVFWFANKENRDTFAARVKYYQPQLGGFSTLALSGGIPDNFHPLDFEIPPSVDSTAWYLSSSGELFFFQNQHDLDTFFHIFPSDSGLIQAKENWKDWLATTTCPSKILFNTACFSSS